MRTALARWLRVGEWWNSKPPLMAAVAYWQLGARSPVKADARIFEDLALFFLATFALAAFGHVLNDFGDRGVDRDSGAPNAVLRAGRNVSAVGLAVLFLGAALPWFWLPTTRLVLTLLGLELALFAAYALPPVRLKGRGVAGIVADAAYGYVIPLIVTLLVFAKAADRHPSALSLTILVAWSFALGLRQILGHQLEDADRDQRTGAATFAVRHGWAATLRLLERVLLIEIVLFLLVVLGLQGAAPWVFTGLVAYTAWVLSRRGGRDIRGTVSVRRLPVVSRVRLLGWDIMSAFQLRWLPLILVAYLASRDAEYGIVLAAHLLVFDNPLRRLWQFGLSSWRHLGQTA